MKKSFKTILSLILVLCMFVSIPLSASAATFVNSKSCVLGGNSQSGKTATMAVWTAATRYVYFDKTNCASHTKGTDTVYHYEKSDTVTYSASKSLTSNYSSAFTILARELGVANSATATVRLGGEYTILSSYASGEYCFRAEFTCYKVVEEVMESTTAGNNIIWSNTISSAPANANGVVRAYKI